MATQEEPVSGEGAKQLGTGALLKEIGSHLELLAKKQFELATTELRADLQSEARAAGGLGIAALAALAGINLLLVTGVLGLAQLMPGWQAGLIVSGATLVVAAILGLVSWRRRLRDPMSRTRKTLKDDAKWTRERLA
jgi:hypothetical protein